jgi:L-asparaginase II
VEAFHPMRWCATESQALSSPSGDAPVYARSSFKPLQMAVLRQLLAQRLPERFASIPSQAWAVGMASHSGDDIHQHWVRWWLEASGLELESLRCGSHAALCGQHSASVACHNCSGKHAAIVACSRWLGWPVEGYTDTAHPYHQHLITYLGDLLGHPLLKSSAISHVHWGVDGCTLPTPALTLTEWQRVFHRFLLTQEAQTCLTIMRHYPELISGFNASGAPRFDLALMQAAPHLVSKVGAMGFLVIWNLPLHQVYVLKCESGSTEFRDAYAWWHLAQQGWINEVTAQPYIPKQAQSPYATSQNTLMYC